MKPFITVVIPSRNRPALLRKAIDSVNSQSFDNFEIVVVNDGSDEQYSEAFNEIAREYGDRLSIVHLDRYPRGHGQSYAINSGVWSSNGDYCTFLDDDDFWTDDHHLEKVHRALTHYEGADVYFTNQLAIEVGATEGEVIWLGDMQDVCRSAGILSENGIYQVDVELLMRSKGFAHLNTSVVKRELFDRIKGLDEDIRWECDRDFYLRLIDEAKKILFNPDVVSQHNVPDKSKANNMTTAISVYQRQNYQIYVLNKAAMLARHPAIVKHARAHKIYALQKVAEAMFSEGRFADASYFSRQVLFTNLSWRWPIYHLRILFKQLLNQGQDKN